MHTSVLVSSLSRFSLSDEIPRLVPMLRAALGLTDDPRLDNFWVVSDVDRERDLYSCHFASPETIHTLVSDGSGYNIYDREIILGMRGVVVKVSGDSSRVVARGFAYTPTLTVAESIDTHRVMEGPQMGSHRFVDFNGGVHHINFDDPNTHSTLLSEGCVLRISKLDGEVFITTNRRLKTDRSRWGTSKEFVKMYHDFGGPKLDTLFSTEFRSSNVTHLFMTVDPDLQIASRFDIGLGHLVYLGHITNDFNDDSVELEQEASTDWFETFKSRGEILRLSSTTEGGDFVFPSCPPTDDRSVGRQIVIPATLTLGDIDRVLTFGSSRMSRDQVAGWDPRLRPGEAVIVHFVDAVTGTNSVVRVCSLAHNWRTAIGNNKPNRYNQFVTYYSMVLPAYVKGLTPTYPDDTPLAEVFNGRQGCVFSYDQLFPRVASPTPEVMLQLAHRLEANPVDLATQVYDWAAEPHPDTTARRGHRDPRDVNFSNIAVCVLMGVPYSFILEAANYYPTFTEQRDTVISFLGKNFSKFKGIHPPQGMPGRFTPGWVDYETSPVRGKEKLSDFPAFRDVKTGGLNFCGQVLMRLFGAAAAFVATRVANGDHMRNGRVLPTFALGSDNLRNLINKEQGASLYAVLVGVSKYINFTPRVAAAQDEEAVDPSLLVMSAPRPVTRRPPPTRRLVSPSRSVKAALPLPTTLPGDDDLAL